MTTYLGFDPGFNGGIGIIFPDSVEVHAMPSTEGKKREYLEAALVQVVASACAHGPVTAAVEKQQAFRGQGVSSTFQTGEGYGLLRGVLAALGIPYVLLRPQEWRRAVGLPDGADKGASVALAQRLFPDLAEQLVGPRGGLRDGLAEAMLIAESRRRMG